MEAPSRASLLISLAASCFVLSGDVAGQSGQQPLPTFRTRTDIVHLDVSVLDKDRHPVRGLAKSDFTVLEDGKPQEITIFEPVDVPDAVPPPVEWMRDVTPDVTTNETRATRLWVLVIDDALIPQEPYAIKTSKKIIQDIVDKFGPEDLVSIVFTADSRKAQDFTNDRTQLLATLARYNPGFATWRGPDNYSPVDTDQHFWLGSVLTVRNVMEAFAAIPHNRKALIWVTPGVPVDNRAKLPDNPNSKVKLLGLDEPDMVARMTHLQIIDLTKDILEIARRANVPVYPIDPMGLGGMEAYLSTRRNDAHYPTQRGQDYSVGSAAATGGRVVMNTNDFRPGIDAIFQENSSYYLVGYTPTNANDDGTFRRLEVKVNRADVTVRTSGNRVAPKPADSSPKSTNTMLTNAIATSVPSGELPLRATVAPFAIPGGHTAAVAIALGVTEPIPEAAAKGRVTVTTELRTTAFTTEGDAKGTQQHTARVTIRPGAQGMADYEVLSRLDLPPGRYRLRMAAHLEAAGKTGTVMADVIVPDFNRDPVSMSGVVLGATPGRPSAPRELLTGILPVVPTAQRAFIAADKATAVFHLYQSGAKAVLPATLAIRITDAHGDKRIDETQQVSIDRFATAEAPALPVSGRSSPKPVATDAFANKALRAAECQYQLPLDSLPAGRYLLTFEATIGETVVRRDVQFEIKPGRE